MAVILQLRDMSGEGLLDMPDMTDSVGMGIQVGDTIEIGAAITSNPGTYKVLNRVIRPNKGMTCVVLDVIKMEP